MKKFFLFLLLMSIVLTITACKQYPEGYYGTPEESSDLPTISPIEIGEIKIDDAYNKINSLKTTNSYSIIITKKDNQSFNAQILDLNETKSADISAVADEKGYVTEFKVFWNTKDYDDSKNTVLIDISKAVITSVWPNYSEENLKILSSSFRFIVDELNNSSGKNQTITAPATKGSIYMDVSDDVVTYGIQYPNNIIFNEIY